MQGPSRSMQREEMSLLGQETAGNMVGDGGKRKDQKPEKELIFEKLLSDIRMRVRHGAP